MLMSDDIVHLFVYRTVALVVAANKNEASIQSSTNCARRTSAEFTVLEFENLSGECENRYVPHILG